MDNKKDNNIIELTRQEEAYLQETNNLLALLEALKNSVELRHHFLAGQLMKTYELDSSKVILERVPGSTSQFKIVDIKNSDNKNDIKPKEE